MAIAIHADRKDFHGTLQPSQNDASVIVSLPTLAVPSHEQMVVGKPSSSAPGIEEFRGIPYGTVRARWQHSQLLRSLPENVFNASRNGPRCPQPADPNNTHTFQARLDFPEDVGESEFDCLNLFIVRPSAAALVEAGYDITRNKLPVYFYIHGGGYAFGANTDPMWNPTRLVSRSLALRKPIIAVAVNYRLNLFGFAASSEIIDAQPECQVKGCNFGLSDQRIALEWVSQNISSFGGDPSRITIGGQSAGAISVYTHVLEAKYGLGRPLFRRAIIQSGAVGTLGPLSLNEADRKWEMLCKYLNVTTRSAGSRLTVLSSIPASKLLEAAENLNWTVFSLIADGLIICPRSDGRWNIYLGQKVTEAIDSLVEEEPTPICVLIGDNDAEGSIYHNRISNLQSFEQLQTIFETAYPSKLISNDILHHYELASDLPLSVLRDRILLFLTDVQFGYPVECAREELSSRESVSMLSGVGRQNEGQFRSEGSYPRPTLTQSYRIKFGNPFPGVSHNVAHHCVELIYIFDCFQEYLSRVDRATVQSDSRSNQDLVQEMQSQWIAFISDDNVGDVQEDLTVVYGPDRRQETVSMVEHPEWVERQQRFRMLAKHWPESVMAATLITGVDLHEKHIDHII